MVEALYNFTKKLRDAKVCSCTHLNVKNPSEFRRALQCACDEFTDPHCASGECLLCGELQLFNLCSCFDYDDEAHKIKWEEYQTITGQRKDGSGFEKKDFVDVCTTYQVFLNHFSSVVWPALRKHHQTAVLQSTDIKYIKTHPSVGVAVDIEDFSQNGKIQPKREHVSRYFAEVGYTLYGMILTAHLDDFTNISHNKREELRALLVQKKLPLQITESHIVVSADLTHDGCAVMHFNDHLLTPYLKANLPCVHTRIRISDGGPNHLKLADLCLHTSKQKVRCFCSYICQGPVEPWPCLRWQVEHGIQLEHVYQATAHAKDLSDSECGGAKHTVEKAQMKANEGETSKVKTPFEAFETIRDNYGQLSHERLIKKGGVGIYRRFIYWVPASGPGSINRNIQHCKTLSSSLGGIKSLHHLCDIGQPGKLRVRVGSCHRCPGCQQGNFAACENVSFVGPTEVIQLHPEGRASVRLSRNALNELGVRLAGEVKPKEIIAVELAVESEPFMLAEVVSTNGPRKVSEMFESFLGQFKVGDMVLDVRKLEPVALGSSHYVFTDKTFPVFIEDIRKRNMMKHLSEVDHSRRSSRVAQTSGVYSGQDRQQQWYVLSADGKLDILKLISADELIGDRRDLDTLAQ